MSAGDRETPAEALARRRLEQHVGLLKRADISGREGAPDYWSSDDPPHGVAAEVTSLRNDAQLRQMAALQRNRVAATGTSKRWHVFLRRRVQVGQLLESPKLWELLRAAESAGIEMLPTGGAPRELESLINELGIEGAMSSSAAPAGTPTVTLSTGASTAWEWQGPRIDRFLGDLFGGGGSVSRRWTALVASKVVKVTRVDAQRKHLYIALDTFTEPGLGIDIALDTEQDGGAARFELPTFAPPVGLTDLWLWPDTPFSRGLRFEQGAGWGIVDEGRLDR